MIFEEVAWDPACRLEVPGDATNATKEVPRGPRKHQEAQESPRRSQEVPRATRMHQEVLGTRGSQKGPEGPRRPQEQAPSGPRNSQKVKGSFRGEEFM